MEKQIDLLRHVAETFEKLGVRYFVTGSIATIYYGEYRATNDVDVVAEVGAGDVRGLCDAFPAPEFYMSEEAARDAVATRFQFNILHVPTGLKVDVIVPAGTAFDESRMARVRRMRPGPGVEAFMASPEDVIVKKMVFYHEGGSDKHLRDIAGVIRVRGDELDRAYIEKWAEEFGVREVWDVVVKREREAG